MPKIDTSIKENVIINDLIILKKDYDKSTDKKTYFICTCTKCGRMRSIRKDAIKKGRNTTHKDCGRMIKKTDKKFYDCWRNMRQRTTNPNATEYENYGGRGICSDDYEYFVDFYDDLYDSYIKHVREFGPFETTLDRIDPNGNYEKENIRWATRIEQNRNLTTCIKIKAVNRENGDVLLFKSLKSASKYFNIHSTAILNRIFHKNKKFKRKINYDFKLIINVSS